MQHWCKCSQNQLDKAYQQLNRAGVYLSDINSDKVRLEFDTQITKLKRLYHDLTNLDVATNLKSEIRDFLQSVETLLANMRKALQKEEFGTES